jgi:hypothetical protein
VLLATLVFGVVTLVAEIWTAPLTNDARLAMDWILGPKKMGRWFWFVGVGLGHVLPLVLLMIGAGFAVAAAAVAALAGILVNEGLWILAPQQVPLS